MDKIEVAFEITEEQIKVIDEIVSCSKGFYLNRNEFIRDCLRVRIHQILDRMKE